MTTSTKQNLTLSIGNVRIPAGAHSHDLAGRIEREIADRAFGRGSDPLVTSIADHVLGAIEASNTKE